MWVLLCSERLCRLDIELPRALRCETGWLFQVLLRVHEQGYWWEELHCVWEESWQELGDVWSLSSSVPHWLSPATSCQGRYNTSSMGDSSAIVLVTGTGRVTERNKKLWELYWQCGLIFVTLLPDFMAS